MNIRGAFVLPLIALLVNVYPVAGQQSTSQLGEETYKRALWAFQHVSSTTYKHNRKGVDEQVMESPRTGDVSARTDSSGFVSWVLFGVSPGHLNAIEDLSPKQDCPKAETFARFLSAIPRREVASGWLNVPSASELQRGDLIAWAVPVPGSKAAYEHGQVMIVAAPPSGTQTTEIDGKTVRYVSVLVIDSSPTAHFGPEQLPPLAVQKQRDGLGAGSVRLLIDDKGKPVAFWVPQTEKGTAEPCFTPTISIGRLVGPAKWPDVHLADIENIRPRAKKGVSSFAF